jgi:hypothetical protein
MKFEVDIKNRLNHLKELINDLDDDRLYTGKQFKVLQLSLVDVFETYVNIGGE